MPIKKTLHTNQLPTGLCQDCGTYLLALPINKGKKQFEVSTWYNGICLRCHKEKPITEERDFGYPTFTPMDETIQFSPNTSPEAQEVLSQVVEATNKAVAEVLKEENNTINVLTYNNFEQSEEYKLLKKLAIEFLSLIKIKHPSIEHKAVIMHLDQNLKYTIYFCFDKDQLAYHKIYSTSFIKEEKEVRKRFEDQQILDIWECNLKVCSITDVPYLDRIDIRDEEGELVSYTNTNFLKTIFFDI